MTTPKIGEKRGPTTELAGPRPRGPAGEPLGAGGAPPVEAGDVTAKGQPSLTEARGAEPEDAAAAAGRREDDGPEEDDSARQPGQGGGEADRRTTLTQRPTGARARRAGTAAGLGTVAEAEEERLEAEAALAETGAVAAAQSAVDAEEGFEGMVEGYPESFWNAVERDGTVEKPPLMDWNEWQAWRSAEGGLPKGVRDREVQMKEVKLFKAAMKRYYGEDHAEKRKRSRQEAKLLKEKQEEALKTARQLFSTRSVGSTGSSRTAADTSAIIRRAGVLLPNKECYAEFMDKMEAVIEVGETCYIGTFSPDFVARIRGRTKILYDVYTEYDLDRDRQELGGSVAEHFFLSLIHI